MLHFILGTAGTGKTTALFRRIESAVKQGEKALLLVPEQLSFESEKRLYRSLGPQLALEVEVLSFTRVCNSIFRRFGGLADIPVTQAAKYLLMSIAVDELRQGLRVYRKSCDDVSFLETLLAACGEFKTAGVTPEKLADAAAGYDDELGDKLDDLSAVYAAYQGLLSKGYTDADDDLIRACATLENNDFFSSYHVFVDGFTTFMSAEFELLGHVIAQSPQVHIAMTCDGVEDAQKGMGVFSTVKAAIARLKRAAATAGVPVAEPEVLEAPVRFASEQLAHLSKELFQPGATAFSGHPDGAVELRVAPDRYQEIEMTAAAISTLAREEGLRYNQIAVITRDTDHYRRAVELVFPRYGIPFFMDEPGPVETHPLVTGLLHAINSIRGNFDTESLLMLAKSPVMGLDAQAVARLENYCYCWNVRGAVWAGPFQNNPRGLAGALTEDDIARLEEINAVRIALVEPLQALKEALSKESGRALAAGLYDFLQQVGAAIHLTAYTDTLPQSGKATFLAESAQIWDEVIGVLDVFGTVLGNIRISRGRLCELLRLALGTAEAGLPPQTLDQVLVGKADRIRPVDLQAVFVIGAVEGEFPAQAAAAGVFSDEERRRMIADGLDIPEPTLQQTVLEKYFAYFAMTLAARRLVVSWPKGDLTGQELLPSVMIAQLQSLFPAIQARTPDDAELAVGDKAALQILAARLGTGDSMESTLREYFAVTERQRSVERMEHARLRPPFALEDRQTARSMFGGHMRLSPTRVERYYRCPFSYFAADGLRIRRRQKVEFSPLESGSVIHHVLQIMVQRHGGAGLSELEDRRLKEEITEIIREYLAQRVENSDALPARFRYLFDRLVGTLSRLLRRLGQEFSQSSFQPVACELPIIHEAGVEPLHLETADGISVAVEGVVDRVDIMTRGGKRYVRVVDYKSGGKTFALHDILYGLNMQMLLYLFTIAENGTGELADAIPAGVLYMPVRERFISAERDTPDGKIEAQREKQWTMTGLLLEDEEVLRGMEKDLAGVFIPAKLGKDGKLDAKSALAGKAELGKLSGKVKDLVVNMAELLASGSIPASPVFDQDYKTCEYCDYRQVCGIEPGDPVREIAKIDREAVLKLLEEEPDNG